MFDVCSYIIQIHFQCTETYSNPNIGACYSTILLMYSSISLQRTCGEERTCQQPIFTSACADTPYSSILSLFNDAVLFTPVYPFHTHATFTSSHSSLWIFSTNFQPLGGSNNGLHWHINVSLFFNTPTRYAPSFTCVWILTCFWRSELFEFLAA